MNKTLSSFVESLKAHLKENKHQFHEHHEMCGSTEGGFYDTDDFDFEAMLKEIDVFSAEFKRGDVKGGE